MSIKDLVEDGGLRLSREYKLEQFGYPQDQHIKPSPDFYVINNQFELWNFSEDKKDAKFRFIINAAEFKIDQPPQPNWEGDCGGIAVRNSGATIFYYARWQSKLICTYLYATLNEFPDIKFHLFTRPTRNEVDKPRLIPKSIETEILNFTCYWQSDLLSDLLAKTVQVAERGVNQVTGESSPVAYRLVKNKDQGSQWERLTNSGV
jgi:hypothetical protein